MGIWTKKKRVKYGKFDTRNFQCTVRYVCDYANELIISCNQHSWWDSSEDRLQEVLVEQFENSVKFLLIINFTYKYAKSPDNIN
jgi:hypothetical protein